MKTLDLSVIIPVHELGTDKTVNRLKEALASISDREQQRTVKEVIVVYAPEAKEKIEVIESNIKEINPTISVKFILNEGKTTFQSQLKLALDSVTTKYFSYLEYDDKYHNIFLKYVDLYLSNVESMKSLDEEVINFFPLSVLVNNDNNDAFVRYGNELCWHNNKELIEVMGELTPQTLFNVSNFNISGGVFETEPFKEVGGFKENMKLTFSYEYLLRATDNGHRFINIPKLCYIHRLRQDSMFGIYERELDTPEISFWYDTAKKEYFFKEDREITYTKPTMEVVA